MKRTRGVEQNGNSASEGTRNNSRRGTKKTKGQTIRESY